MAQSDNSSGRTPGKIGVIFGLVCLVLLSAIGIYELMANSQQNDLLSEAIESGKCRVLELEEVSNGRNRIRYQCAKGGLQVVKVVDDSLFEKLLKRHQEQHNMRE